MMWCIRRCCSSMVWISFGFKLNYRYTVAIEGGAVQGDADISSYMSTSEPRRATNRGDRANGTSVKYG